MPSLAITRRRPTVRSIARRLTRDLIEQFKNDEPFDLSALDDLVILLVDSFSLSPVDVFRLFTEGLVAQQKRWIAINLAKYLSRQRATGPRAVALFRQRLRSFGITPAAPHLLTTFVETQKMAIKTAQTWQAGRDPNVWGFRYVTRRDNRVRPTHAALDGVTLPTGDPFWKTFWPPNGWNCRCRVVIVKNPVQTVTPSEAVAPDFGFDNNIAEILGI